MQDLEKTKPLSANEEFELGLRARDGDEKAIDTLVRSNLRFVVSVAKMYSREIEEMQELIQAGNIGLIKAASNFDPTRGFKFISYAVFHIRNEIIQELTNNSRMIRLPSNKVQIVSKAKKGHSILYSTLGREPTEAELLDWLKGQTPLAASLTETKLREIMIGDLRTSSIDQKINDDDSSSSSFAETLKSPTPENSDVFDVEYRAQILNDIMTDLTEEDRAMILDYFGLNKFQMQMSTYDLGARMGITAESVRNRINRCIRRMKLSARKRGLSLKDFLAE